MSVRDDLAALCSLEAKIGALTEQRDALRRRLLDHALDTFENEGAAPTWRAGALGTVGLTVPKPRVEVVDEDAFAQSAISIAGEDAVEAVLRVRHNVKDAILATATPTNSGSLVNPDGEVLAGVTASARLPYLNVRLSKEAKQAASDELAIEEARELSLKMNADELDRWKNREGAA